MARNRQVAAWTAVVVWCAVCGWFAFARSRRVPVVSLVDFGFHELGHLVMYVLPISELLTAAMGSIAQCAIPLGLAAYFWFARREAIGAVACMAWASANFQDVSVYIADAPYEELPLVGGEHDWAYILGPEQLDRLSSAGAIASAVRGAGLLLWLTTAVLAVYGLTEAVRSRECDRADSTMWR